METLHGLVEHIVYHNENNGYTVLALMCQGDEVMCTGTMAMVNEGEYIKAEGDYVEHATYGRQFRIVSFSIEAPEDLFSIERYLGSGAIKGIGPALAGRIVKKFKEDSFRIIENEPERLAEVKGISERKAQEIYQQFHDKQDIRQAMMFLSKYGITTAYAVKIYNEYGSRLYDIIRENPYQLAEDVSGIGFRLADDIARKAGISPDSDYRIRSGVIYVLLQASMNGHVYLPVDELKRQAAEILEISEDGVDRQLMELSIDKKIIIKTIEDRSVVYASIYYYLELSTARMLKNLNIKYEVSLREAEHQIHRIETDEKISLDEMQKTAVVEAARNGVLVITGGPGTGKTTTINTMIRFFENEGLEIRLAAPTGRAAKRMTEATGCEAQTIHRMLELTGGPEDTTGSHFERNEQNPLETDVIIIDEMSMVDIHLMNALLKAVMPGTRLIMVGDVNQLPSVGPGNVLKDIIDSKAFSVVRLSKIYRQAESSHIVLNAHKINAGELITLDNKNKDFFFFEKKDVRSVMGALVYLVKTRLPEYIGASPFEIQVLTPMRKGELGVEHLNEVLQYYLNPASESKKEKEGRTGVFREGDKVMQVKNNYKLEWKITNAKGFSIEEGLGVFNGDMGIIKQINTYSERITVVFDENREAEYPFSSLDELELAYAITIHKSQGSEYPAVVLPLLSGPPILCNRNLLYTAITRAQKCVAIAGRQSMVEQMIHNETEQKRYSGLNDCLKEGL